MLDYTVVSPIYAIFILLGERVHAFGCRSPFDYTDSAHDILQPLATHSNSCCLSTCSRLQQKFSYQGRQGKQPSPERGSGARKEGNLACRTPHTRQCPNSSCTLSTDWTWTSTTGNTSTRRSASGVATAARTSTGFQSRKTLVWS